MTMQRIETRTGLFLDKPHRIEVFVDTDRLVANLGKKAAYSRGKRSVAASGAVVVTIKLMERKP